MPILYIIYNTDTECTDEEEARKKIRRFNEYV